jgi:hypothetical protein
VKKGVLFFIEEIVFLIKGHISSPDGEKEKEEEEE